MPNLMPRSRAGILACASLLCLPSSRADLELLPPVDAVQCERQNALELWTCKARGAGGKALLLVNGKRQYESSSLADCQELLRLKLEVPGCSEASDPESDDALGELELAGNNTVTGWSAGMDDGTEAADDDDRIENPEADDPDDEQTGHGEALSPTAGGVEDKEARADPTQGDLPEPEIQESEGSGGASSGTWFALVGVSGLVFVFGAWQAMRWLTSPKKTPAPLLADTELGEGDPVTSSEGPGSALWAASGSRQARQFMSQQPSAGFTQF